MFTGLIQCRGRVRSLLRNSGGARIHVDVVEPVHPRLAASAIGDSIAVNGVCLTVTRIHGTPWGFEADMMPETLEVTCLGKLKGGDRVNLEAALRMGDSLGGHLVSGDVDGRARVQRVENRGNALVVNLEPEDTETMRWIVLRGRVAVDGASLTVMEVDKRSFSVSLIPHSREHIILGEARPGTLCNLETDLLARHFCKAQGGYSHARR